MTKIVINQILPFKLGPFYLKQKCFFTGRKLQHHGKKFTGDHKYMPLGEAKTGVAGESPTLAAVHD